MNPYPVIKHPIEKSPQAVRRKKKKTPVANEPRQDGFPALTDEELAMIADELFVELDRNETNHESISTR